MMRMIFISVLCFALIFCMCVCVCVYSVAVDNTTKFILRVRPPCASIVLSEKLYIAVLTRALRSRENCMLDKYSYYQRGLFILNSTRFSERQNNFRWRFVKRVSWVPVWINKPIDVVSFDVTVFVHPHLLLV